MDQTKFLNTYIDVILSTAHEQINSIVQLKTNLRIAEDNVKELSTHIENIDKEKQELIQRIDSEVRVNADRDEVIKKLNERIEVLSGEVDGYKQKASHVDTFAQQIVLLKQELEVVSGEVDGYKQKASHVDTFAQQIVLLKQELEKTQKIPTEKKIPKKLSENKDDF